MKLSIYRPIFEDAQADADRRAVAEQTFEAIKAYLATKPELVERPNGNLVVWVGKVVPQFKNLELIFSPDLKGEEGQSLAGGFGSKKSNPSDKAIMLPVLLEPGSDKYLETRFNSLRITFVHEFMHYLDDARFKGKAIGSATKFSQAGEAAYYNDPSEMNAFYQEVAEKVDDKIRFLVTQVLPRKPDIARELLDRNLPADPHQFTSYILTWDWKDARFDPDMIEALTPTNRRHLLKRLYGLHGYLRAKYRDALASPNNL